MMVDSMSGKTILEFKHLNTNANYRFAKGVNKT